MAVPKRKISKSRGRKRRANYKLVKVGMAKCAHCTEAIVPHRVCPHCGYYAGVEVVQPKED